LLKKGGEDHVNLELEQRSSGRSSAKVAVIVVNYNGAAYLERCLLALDRQSVKPHQVVIVDNASNDDSVALIKSFASVTLIEPGANLGFARGNNVAVAAAAKECNWIALLNPDAFADPDWLKALLEASNENPSFDMFGSKLISSDEPTMLDGTGDAYHVSGLVWRTGHGVSVSYGANETREMFSPCAAAAMYRRSLLERVGGFDEQFFCYVEDVDIGFRMRLYGARCLYVPQSVAHHVGSGTTGGQHGDFASYHGHRNLVWTYVKNMPGILFWLFLPLHIALNVITVVWFSLRGQGRLILKAKVDAIRGLPVMWRKRKEIQRNRVVSIGEVWQQLNKTIPPTKAKRQR
jgi:GT2 family glycosyltransferase